MRKFEKKQLEASVTIEAVFVVPIVIFIVFALMYLALYLHDRAVTETILEEALGRGNFVVLHRGSLSGDPCNYDVMNEPENWGYFQSSYCEQEERVEQYLKMELKEGPFISHLKKVDCIINGFAIQIRIEMEQRISLNPVKSFWGEETSFILERKRVFHNPEEILRAYEGTGITIDHEENFNFIRNYIFKNRTVLEGE